MVAKARDARIPVAIYTRFSTDRQDARSLEDQARRCRAYAAARGMVVVGQYSDAGVSGSHVLRDGMQKLRTAANTKGGAPFRSILVDDLSRLSRDLGDTWQLVYSEFAAVDVTVTDVTTGMASDQPGARTLFATMGIVNDTFLQLVKTETHRGLEGRALGGFWTGGRVFGYATVQEENPPDREHPRKRMIIHPEHAATVNLVFRLFVDGHGLKAIAKILNEDGIAAPNDGGRGNKRGTGWGHSTIRAMLRNERYVGRVTWNKHKHVRAQGRKSRRQIVRPESEWITRDYPELAIIAKELWEPVQARFQRTQATARGRPAGTGTSVHLVSGLLRCGTCGGSMTVVGAKKKDGVVYSRFGCTAHSSRGDTSCANGLSVSENQTSTALVAALKEKLDRPELFKRFVTKLTSHAGARAKASPSDERSIECQVHVVERRVANLTDALANAGWSDALGAKLRQEEADLQKLKAERTAAARSHPPPHVPSPAAAAGYFRKLIAIAETDPVRGRELLARFVAPIVMTPKAEGPDRGYRGTGAFNLSFFLSVGTAVPDRSGKSSCAGRI